MFGESINQILDGILSEYKFYKGNVNVPINEIAELIAQLIKIDRIIDEREQLDYGIRFDMARKMIADSLL
jgi:hypothetical protein